MQPDDGAALQIGLRQGRDLASFEQQLMRRSSNSSADRRQTSARSCALPRPASTSAGAAGSGDGDKGRRGAAPELATWGAA